MVEDAELQTYRWYIRVCRRIFPPGSKAELKNIAKLAWPVSSTQLMLLLFSTVSVAMTGQFGREYLDSVSMAITITNVFGMSVMYGLGTACETLFAQTYGSTHKDRMGIILQRSLMILTICCIPCFAIFLNTEHLLRLVGLKPNIARMGGQYAEVYISGLPAFAISLCLFRYLQAQSIVIPSLVIGFVANLINAGLHAVFLYGFGAVIWGSSLSLSITQWCFAAMHVAYIRISKVYEGTWNGFSTESLHNWGPFFSLALPGLAMVCLEWWAFEALALIAGNLGEVPLAAHVVTYQVASIVFMVSYGIAVAGGVSVGNHLGAAQPQQAETASRVTGCTGLVCAILLSLTIFALKDFIPRIFSQDKEVISLAIDLILQLCIFVIFDGFQGSLAGVLRGSGRQRFGATVNLVVYYLIALPVAIPLMLLTDLGVKGAWWGLVSGNSTQAVVFFIRVVTTNWENETEKAEKRTDRIITASKPSSSESGASNTDLHDNGSSINTIVMPSPETYSSQATLVHVNQSDPEKMSTDSDPQNVEFIKEPDTRSLWRVIVLRLVFVMVLCLILGAGVFSKFYFKEP